MSDADDSVEVSRKRSRSPVSDSDGEKKKKQRKKKEHKSKKSHHTKHADRDAKLVAPLPFISFLKSRLTPKACGRCAECKKPPCGQCKACVQNIKTQGVKEHRRCEALKCAKDMPDANVKMPDSVPNNKNELSDELFKVSGELAEISEKRGLPDFDSLKYDSLIERQRSLREGLIILKNRKARKRVKFQVGFHDVWGVIMSLEKDRLKFAKFIVRTASSEECRTIDMKRKMRDDLEVIQLDLARKHAAILCPLEEKEAFLEELEKTRL